MPTQDNFLTQTFKRIEAHTSLIRVTLMDKFSIDNYYSWLMAVCVCYNMNVKCEKRFAQREDSRILQTPGMKSTIF